jgi:hypothetical protein
MVSQRAFYFADRLDFGWHVKEAWDSITSDQLLDLLKTMSQRYEDVIAAEGGHTKW